MKIQDVEGIFHRSDIIRTELNLKMNNSFILVWLMLNMTDKLRHENLSQSVPRKQSYSVQTDLQIASEKNVNLGSLG